MQLKVLNVIHADKGYQQTIVLFDQYIIYPPFAPSLAGIL